MQNQVIFTKGILFFSMWGVGWVFLFCFLFVFGNRHLSSAGQILERTLDATLSRNLLSLERSAVSVSAFYTLVLSKVLGFLQRT